MLNKCCANPLTLISAKVQQFKRLKGVVVMERGFKYLVSHQYWLVLYCNTGKSKLFCDWLTKQRPGWHKRVYSFTVQLCTQYTSNNKMLYRCTQTE